MSSSLSVTGVFRSNADAPPTGPLHVEKLRNLQSLEGVVERAQRVVLCIIHFSSRLVERLIQCGHSPFLSRLTRDHEALSPDLKKNTDTLGIHSTPQPGKVVQVGNNIFHS